MKVKINFNQIKAWMLNEDKSDLLSNFESEYQMFSQERQEYISTLINNDLLDPNIRKCCLQESGKDSKNRVLKPFPFQIFSPI